MRKKRKNYSGILVSLFIAFIMVTSIIGFIVGGGSGTNTIKYKDIKFSQTQHGWSAKFKGNRYVFAYTPTDLEYIEFPDTINLAGLPQIDLTYDPNSEFKGAIAASIYELTSIISTSDTFLRTGFTTNNTYNLPVINCNSTSVSIPVILFRRANNTQILHENNCIIVESNNENSFLSYADRIVYEILGIM